MVSDYWQLRVSNNSQWNLVMEVRRLQFTTCPPVFVSGGLGDRVAQLFVISGQTGNVECPYCR